MASEMSVFRMARWIPLVWREETNVCAEAETAPLREIKIRCRAPWVTSHWAMLRPRPPRPPARR